MPINDSTTDITNRRDMVDHQLRSRDIDDKNVLSVIEQLPRHHFIPPENRHLAYGDYPVNIGHGQTISQPYIVALMTEKLQLAPDHNVLEIGTGCGYQTAILAKLVKKVYTVELIEQLARFGRDNVSALGIDNVEYHIGDGRKGWPAELSPGQREMQFDRILVAAAAHDVPTELLNQLAQGGKMVIPIGGQIDQRLILLEKHASKITEHLLCYCRFVKLKGH